MIRVVSALLVCLVWAGCGDVPCKRIADLDFEAPPVSLYPTEVPSSEGGFIVFGDTQRTSWQECIIGREVNDAATETLIQPMADAKPAFAVVVGDLVFHGADEEHWRFFDMIATPLRDAEVPLLPVVGNHEYWGSNDSALENLRARFSRLATDTWYSERYGALGLVVVDSNYDELDEATWQRQAAWYGEVMAELEEDPEVKGLLVFVHAPPYTNSTIVSGDDDVREAFVPAFCQSSKGLGFISGHAHGYERFLRGSNEGCGDRSRHFIVTAGGGGPRPDSLRSFEETGNKDLFRGQTPRPFHYLWMMPTDAGVAVEVRGFQRGSTEVGLLESFTLDY